jgi:hypothetical protein
VCEIILESLTLNDIASGKGVYHIELPSTLGDDVKPHVYFVNEDGTKRYRASIAQLAALRVYTGKPKDFACEWSKDFKSKVNCLSLQDFIRTSKSDASWLERAKFTCTAQMLVLNSSLPTPTPVYRRNCYSGHDAYKEQVDAFRAANGAAWFDTIDARIQLSKLRKELETSGLKKGADEDANRVQIPVFTVA